MMRTLLKILLLFLMLLAGGVFWLASQSVSSQPVIPAAGELSMADMERLRAVYRRISPASMQDGERRQIRLTPGELELALNYLLMRSGHGQAQVAMHDGELEVGVSLRLPTGTTDGYLNAGGAFASVAGELVLSRVRFGDVALPGWLFRPLFTPLRRYLLPHLVSPHLVAASPQGLQLQALSAMLRDYRIADGHLQMTLVWDRLAAQRAMDAARSEMAGVTPEQMAAYRQRLTELAGVRPQPGFAALMGEGFRLARARSVENDPVTENRALLLVLAEEANGVRLGLHLPAAAHFKRLRLGGREDFVQHFTLSASIAAVMGRALAEQAGLDKEVGDTGAGGSGFSFTDLAADRAGTRFGLLATATPDSARRVQEMLAGSADESLYMPGIGDLPEFLSLQVFQQRYGGVDGAGYRRVLAEIDRRIDALPVYREANASK